MRGKRLLVLASVLFVAIGGGVIAVAMGGEPELEPRAPSLSPRGSKVDRADEPSAVAALDAESEEMVAGGELLMDQPTPQEVVEQGEPLAGGAISSSCDHPFVPSTPGSWRRYSWRQSGEDQVAELRIEALSARELDDGEREIAWNVQVSANDVQLAAERMVTRCTPGQSAEEPWFGILERSLGLRLKKRPRWRWPAELRAGVRFEGVARFDTEGAEMRAPEDGEPPSELRVTRRHSVGERERVDVPAGRFRAWRVQYEERHAFGEHGESGTGVVWVAPDLGLIKSTAENSQGVSQSIELVAYGARP